MRTNKLKSGEFAPKKGEYKIVNRLGNVVKTGITMDKGETMPPTPNKTQHFEKQ